MCGFYLRVLLALVGRALPILGLAFLVAPGIVALDWAFFVVVACAGWLVPATQHVLSTRGIAGPERWRVRQRIEVLVEMPAEEALERCTKAVRGRPQFRNVRMRGSDAIEARIRSRWSGERVSCGVIATDERHTRVVVSSRPVWPTECVDHGRNWEHVVAIREALVRGLPPGARRSRGRVGPRARSPRRSLRPRCIARPG